MSEPRVHVHAPPERDIRGDADARLCSAPDLGETVVFHPNSQTSSMGEDFWAHCPDCGCNTEGDPQ